MSMVPDLTNLWLAAGTGFVMGIQHAADADHVVAVSTIVARTKKARAAWIVGACWGLGHTLTLLLAGGALVMLRTSMPEGLAHGLECAVGVALVILGLAAIMGAVGRGGLLSHRHEHGHEEGHPHHLGVKDAHTHEHSHLPALEALARAPGPSSLWRSFGLGMLHGLAGSSALSLALLAAMPGPIAALAYLVVFGLGTLAGMSLLSAVLSWSMLRISLVQGLGRWLEPVVGAASVVIGALLVIREGFQ